MSRTIITHVGTSTLNEQGILKGYTGLKRLRDILEANRTPSDTELNQCIDEAARTLKRIWTGPATLQGRRAQSPAEIASLSLLKPQAGDKKNKGDRVSLLHSDTPDGRFC